MLPSEIACSSVAVLQPAEALADRLDHYLIVGNSFSAKIGASVNVYKWSRHWGKFEFHHSPTPVGTSMAFVSKMSSLVIGQVGRPPQHLLAIANFWDGESTSVPSPLLTFDAADGSFQVIASIVGSGAIDVVLVPVKRTYIGECTAVC
jgi:hypothetical protein